LLGTRPSDLAKVFEKTKTRFADKTVRDEERSRLLDVLALFPAQARDHIIPVLWESAPSAFSTAHMTAFASGGPEPMLKALQSRAKNDVVAAAYYGVRGDARGKAVLQAAAGKLDVSKGVVAEPVVAALGLAGLGDDKAIQKVQTTLRDAALCALDGNDLAAARRATLSVERIFQLKGSGERVQLAWLETDLQMHCAERGAHVESAEDVFSLLESLRF
jgi:hypothetical protein